MPTSFGPTPRVNDYTSLQFNPSFQDARLTLPVGYSSIPSSTSNLITWMLVGGVGLVLYYYISRLR